MSTITKLKKTDFIPFIDIHKTGDVEDWARVDYSTVFSLAFNPQSESKDYISFEMPIEEVSHYLPEMSQEIALFEGNKAYDYVCNLYETGLPVGTDCNIPILLCFGGTSKRAWKSTVTLLLGDLNTVEGKVTFSLKFGGGITYGTYIITTGKPVFTETVAGEDKGVI